MTLEGRTLSIEQLDAIEVLRNLLPELRQIIERLEKKRRRAPQIRLFYPGRPLETPLETPLKGRYSTRKLEEPIQNYTEYEGPYRNLEIPLN